MLPEASAGTGNLLLYNELQHIGMAAILELGGSTRLCAVDGERPGYRSPAAGSDKESEPEWRRSDDPSGAKQSKKW